MTIDIFKVMVVMYKAFHDIAPPIFPRNTFCMSMVSDKETNTKPQQSAANCERFEYIDAIITMTS